MKTASFAFPSAESVGGSTGGRCLNLVTVAEVEHLKAAIARGVLPIDLETKLADAAHGSLHAQYVARHCRWFVEILLAIRRGEYRKITPQQFDRLTWVMAYVRKNDDAIPDYWLNGFLDDQEEVRLAMADLECLLGEFKQWWIETRVPEIWLKSHATAT